MTDQELLEAAANAAEMTIGDYLPGMGVMRYEGTSGNYSKHRWNPLTDDGDALRLAVRLGIGVLYAEFTGEAEARWDRGTFRLAEYGPDDPCAATRRAIVRAAAEIGRTT